MSPSGGLRHTSKSPWARNIGNTSDDPLGFLACYDALRVFGASNQSPNPSLRQPSSRPRAGSTEVNPGRRSQCMPLQAAILLVQRIAPSAENECPQSSTPGASVTQILAHSRDRWQRLSHVLSTSGPGNSAAMPSQDVSRAFSVNCMRAFISPVAAARTGAAIPSCKSAASGA